MTYTKTSIEQTATEKKISQSTINKYFTTIEAEDFSATAALFVTEGKLLTPFEKPIVGRQAIALYLSQEARGMQLLPQETIYDFSEDKTVRITIVGKVQTSLFTVNVSWHFRLNSIGQIATVKIKLLASSKELLNIQNSLNKNI